MFNKLSVIAAAIVTFAFVFASVAHACSGLTSMNSAVQERSMNMGTTDSAPCGQEKPPDICKFVRDAMLSIKPSVSGVHTPEKMVSPPAIAFVSPLLLDSAPVALVIKVSFHPVFKLPLRLSYLVLRI
jgi:hypothetical protein